MAAILAAGSGSRFGADKTSLLLRGRPLWKWAYDAFKAHPDIDGVGIVTTGERIASVREQAPDAAFVIAGGSDRQESSRLACDAADADALLVHDAARPFVSTALISRVTDSIRAHGAAAPAAPVTDTIRSIGADRPTLIDRSSLVAMQTPQGALLEHLRIAHAEARDRYTDEFQLLQAASIDPQLVEGDRLNFKVTTPEDWILAQSLAGVGEIRTGFGYDIHAFSPDAGRPCMLGGVLFPECRGLEGHSDADVLLHAITDAIFGAAGQGDLGVHFPPSDARWKDYASIEFVRMSGDLIGTLGWRILNIDATVIAETPRIQSRAPEIRATIAHALGIGTERVSIKATTNEGLGSIGRGEGIAAQAVATIAGR